MSALGLALVIVALCLSLYDAVKSQSLTAVAVVILCIVTLMKMAL